MSVESWFALTTWMNAQVVLFVAQSVVQTGSGPRFESWAKA